MSDILEVAQEQVLERGVGLTQEQLVEVLQSPDDQLADLLALAHEVRVKWCGEEVEVEGIISLKTGGCPEDCHFCSQSGQFTSPVRSVRLNIPELVEAARSYFGDVVTTHSFEERWETCLMVKESGMELCCGGLVGMGETLEQRAELAAQLAELDPHEVPLNFLNPRPGTPFGDLPVMDGRDALRTIAAFRLAMPRTILRYAGGRELTLGDLGTRDGLLGGINAVIVGNYLTTLGRKPEEDLDLLHELKMPVKELQKTL